MSRIKLRKELMPKRVQIRRSKKYFCSCFLFFDKDMALKIFLVVAVACFTQVVARGPLFVEKQPPKGNLDYEPISTNFIEKLDAMYDFADAVTLKGIQPYLKKKQPLAALCYKQQKGAHLTLGLEVDSKLRQIIHETASKLNQKKKLFKPVQVPLKSISDTVYSLPNLMWYLLKDEEFDQAAILIEEYWESIRKSEAKFESGIQKFKKEDLDAATKLEEQYNGIRKKAQVRSKNIIDNFKKCMAGEAPQQSETSVEHSEESNADDYDESDYDNY